MTTENNREQIPALLRRIESFNNGESREATAIIKDAGSVLAAIQQYKDSLLSEVGEPFAYGDNDIDGEGSKGVSFDPLSGGFNLYTEDQLIAARKPLEDEIGTLKEEISSLYCLLRQSWDKQPKWIDELRDLARETLATRQQNAELTAEIEQLKGNKNAQLDSDSNNPRANKLRELDGTLEMGQLLEDCKNQKTGNSKTVGDIVLTDTFCGDDDALIRSVEALIAMDLEGALVPHGIGGHARALLSDLVVRLNKRNQQNAELKSKLAE